MADLSDERLDQIASDLDQPKATADRIHYTELCAVIDELRRRRAEDARIAAGPEPFELLPEGEDRDLVVDMPPHSTRRMVLVEAAELERLRQELAATQAQREKDSQRIVAYQIALGEVQAQAAAMREALVYYRSALDDPTDYGDSCLAWQERHGAVLEVSAGRDLLAELERYRREHDRRMADAEADVPDAVKGTVAGFNRILLEERDALKHRCREQDIELERLQAALAECEQRRLETAAHGELDAEAREIVAAVEALSGNLIVRRDHNSHPYAVSYCWRPWSTGPTLLAALRAAVAARKEVV